MGPSLANLRPRRRRAEVLRAASLRTRSAFRRSAVWFAIVVTETTSIAARVTLLTAVPLTSLQGRERLDRTRLPMAKIPLHEVRRLTVPVETALDAVLDLDAEQGGQLAFGPIAQARVETDPEPGLSVVAHRRGTDETERRLFTLPILAAALIRYCWKCRIPLPRHGSKRIEALNDGFVFTIEGTVEVVRRHAALPKPSAAASHESLRSSAQSAPDGELPTQTRSQSESRAGSDAPPREEEEEEEAAQAVAG